MHRSVCNALPASQVLNVSDSTPASTFTNGQPGNMPKWQAYLAKAAELLNLYAWVASALHGHMPELLWQQCACSVEACLLHQAIRQSDVSTAYPGKAEGPYQHLKLIVLYCAGSGGLASPPQRSQLSDTFHSIDISYQVFWTIYSSYREEAQNFNATIVQHNFVKAIRESKNLEVCLCSETPSCAVRTRCTDASI